MEIFASAPEGMGLDAIGDFARRVEAIGYDGFFVSDAIHDGLLLACQALTATTRITVSTSVLVAFPRSPMNVALAAWDLQKLSQGRFELGLGTQIRQNIEERYAARWLPPVAGMREYLAALRAIFHSFQTGAPLHFEGEYYRFTRLQPFFNPGPIPFPAPALMTGAVGPKMLAMTGQHADGLHTHPTNSARRYLQEVVQPHLSIGIEKRDTSLQPLKVCVNALVATGADNAAIQQAREHYRQMLAFLFSTPAYWTSLELFGWQAIGESLLQCAREKRWQDMSTLINDEMLDTFLVSSNYNELPEKLLARYGDIADRITVAVPAEQEQDAALAEMLKKLR